MMMNLMTVLVKKVFTSSNPAIVRFLCPPPCGPFSIQESAVGGLSYKVRKNPVKQDSPPQCDNVFYVIGDSIGISYYIKNADILQKWNISAPQFFTYTSSGFPVSISYACRYFSMVLSTISWGRVQLLSGLAFSQSRANCLSKEGCPWPGS